MCIHVLTQVHVVVLSECMSVDVPSNENGNSLIINLISVIPLSLSDYLH